MNAWQQLAHRCMILFRSIPSFCGAEEHAKMKHWTLSINSSCFWAEGDGKEILLNFNKLEEFEIPLQQILENTTSEEFVEALRVIIGLWKEKAEIEQERALERERFANKFERYCADLHTGFGLAFNTTVERWPSWPKENP